MTLAAGTLRHSVTLQRPVVVSSPYGERETSWQDVATVRADFHPLSAREFVAAQQLQAQVSARVVIRYRDDVDATMRLVHNGKPYDIAGVLPDPVSGREYLTLPVTAVTP